jgi:hypothetical protein
MICFAGLDSITRTEFPLTSEQRRACSLLGFEIEDKHPTLKLTSVDYNRFREDRFNIYVACREDKWVCIGGVDPDSKLNVIPLNQDQMDFCQQSQLEVVED